MHITFKTVAGRRFDVEAEKEDKVEDVLHRVTTANGYSPQGARLMKGGKTLLPTDTLEEAGVDDGHTLIFVAVKAPFSSEGREKDVHKTPTREKASKVDFSQPQYDGPLDLAHRQGMSQLEGAVDRHSSEEEFAGLLRIHPTVTHFRSLIQADRSKLEPVLRQIHAIAPKFLEAVTAHQEMFLRLLNEPPQDYPDQHHQPYSPSMWNGEDEEGMTLGQLGEGFILAPSDDLQATDLEALARIQGIGTFPRDLVLQAFFDAGRNEHLAAQYLVDLAAYDPLAFHIAHRQAANAATAPEEVEIERLNSMVAAAARADDKLAMMEHLLELGRLLSQASDVDCEAVLARALEASLFVHCAGEHTQQAVEGHALAAQRLADHYASTGALADQLLLHEHLSLMALSQQGLCKPSAFLPPLQTKPRNPDSPLVSMARLVNTVRDEGMDVVYVHITSEGRLAVWLIQHSLPGNDARSAVSLKRSCQLSEDDTAFLLDSPREMAAALAAPCTQQRTWAMLHKIHALIFGPAGCTDWLPPRVHFCSPLQLPYHALAEHGGVPIGRGRLVTQSPSLLWLEASQGLARSSFPSSSLPLRRAFVGQCPTQAVSQAVSAEELNTGEATAVLHIGRNVVNKPVVKGPADLAILVPSPDVGWDVSSTAWDGSSNALWCCAAVVPILPVLSFATSPTRGARNSVSPPRNPQAPACKDGHAFALLMHRLLTEGRSKIDAYGGALASSADSSLRSWVPWVFIGTSLALGGRKAHAPADLENTDGYKYLEDKSMHLVMNSMVQHLLDLHPDDPVASLLSYLESHAEELHKLTGP